MGRAAISFQAQWSGVRQRDSKGDRSSSMPGWKDLVNSQHSMQSLIELRFRLNESDFGDRESERIWGQLMLMMMLASSKLIGSIAR